MKITKEQAKKLALKVQERITKYQEDIEEASYGNPYDNEEYYIEQEFKEEMIDICKKYNLYYWPKEPGYEIAESIQYQLMKIYK